MRHTGAISRCGHADVIQRTFLAMLASLDSWQLTRQEYLVHLLCTVCDNLPQIVSYWHLDSMSNFCVEDSSAVYMDAKENMPHLTEPLHLVDGDVRPVKSDALKQMMWFCYTDRQEDEAYPLKAEKVKEILKLNSEGKLGASIAGDKKEKVIDFKSAAGEDSITRFDEVKKKRNGKQRGRQRFNKRNGS